MSPLRLLVVVALLAVSARGEVTLAPLFTSGAVLQRDKPIPVWGQAAPGEKIVLTFGLQKREATADAAGRWIVFLDAVPASNEGIPLIVSGKNVIVIPDVVVGEVWLCSGQSNMEFTLEARPGWQATTRVKDADAEIAAANFPLIRHVRIEQAVAEKPAAEVPTSGWRRATPEHVGGFTAVGYFFARDVHRKLGVPIGLVHASWGGTPIESWLSPVVLGSDPRFIGIAGWWAQILGEYESRKAARAEWDTQHAAAESAARKQGPAAHAAFLRKHPRPPRERGPGDPWTPGGLFNGMINPLLPYALRGVLWYQGESNAVRAAQYRDLFPALITSWRQHLGQGDVPFFWVNLAAFDPPEDSTGTSYALLREAQTQALALPNTGQAIAIDIGDPFDIHPTNKQEVGRRLALLARNRVYGISGDDTGPTFAGAAREGQALRVRFAHADTGLVAHEKPVQSLEIAGEDRVFHPAVGRIEKGTLVVSALAVPNPVAVRYAWRNAPEANLYNGAGLPAVPFRSDNW